MISIDPTLRLPFPLRWRTIKDGRFVRLIYVDEAGTSAKEPVRVVTAIIVHGDDHLRQMSAEIQAIFDRLVPAHLRKGFTFHGLKVFNGGKYREEWAFEDRLDLFAEVLALPRIFDVPIAVAVTFKGALPSVDEVVASIGDKNINATLIEHASAFARCLERADVFLRKYLDGKETGAVVAEDVPHARKHLAKMGMMFKHQPLEMPGDHQVQSAWQKELGVAPEGYTYEIQNIVDVPHFVDKSGAPLLQIADACAFAFRRFLAKQSYGKELILAMLGAHEGNNVVGDPAWFSGLSSGLLNTRSYWSEEDKQREAGYNTQIVLKRFLES